MLSTVLYRFYADYEDGFVSATVGLGTYRDGSAVHECWNERKEEICSRKTKKLTKGLAISRDV